MRLSSRLLVTVGLLSVAIDFDHAPPNDVRLSLQSLALIQQVARAMGHFVVLMRVIGKMLLAIGEHHAVDLRMSALAGERDVLVDLGQPAS